MSIRNYQEGKIISAQIVSGLERIPPTNGKTKSREILRGREGFVILKHKLWAEIQIENRHKKLHIEKIN